MKKILVNFTCLLSLGLGLSACSMFQQSSDIKVTSTTSTTEAALEDQSKMLAQTPINDAALAGDIESSMDVLDKTKLSRALDGGLGKATHWTNVSTGASYTVIPTRKVVVSGNAFCREYSVTMTRGGKTSDMTGRACVASDGAWHPV